MKTEASTAKPTVNRIFDAAIQLFALKGFAAVSVKELANAAGVNIALISYYFGGKENLYSLVLEQQFKPVTELLEKLNQEQLPPLDKIRRFVESLAAISDHSDYGDRLFYSEIINPTSCFDSVVKKNLALIHGFLRDYIDEAVRSGHIRGDLDPDYMTIALINIIHFHCVAKHFSVNFTQARDNHAECYAVQALDIFLNGVLSSMPAPLKNRRPDERTGSRRRKYS